VPQRRVRYAVVGLGHIAQVAVLPAFAHVRQTSELAALVSGDPQKLSRLGRRYRVEIGTDYDGFDELARSGAIDAVYIALPNAMHREYTIRAADAGLHVVCEKPLATTVADCRAMIAACRRKGVALMTAYRLHFEAASLAAVDLVRRKRLGDPRYFHSMFSMRVGDPDNVRLSGEQGGGPLLDLGVYCIEAARSLFRDEPLEVLALETVGEGARFREVPEATSVLLRFPGERLASFTCSFDAADTSMYRIVGTKGSLTVEPAYEYAEALEYELVVDERHRHRRFAKRDQFAAEIEHFSRCVLEGRPVEPSGETGLADVRIIEAVRESARTGRTVRLAAKDRVVYPSPAKVRRLPPVREPEEIHARGPSAR
jgi:predicted dehydrogenase